VVHGGHAVVAPGAISDLLAHVRSGVPGAGSGTAIVIDPEVAAGNSARDARHARTPGELSAAREFLAEATVKSHVGRVLAKLGLRDRVRVVLYANDHGLLPRGWVVEYLKWAIARPERRTIALRRTAESRQRPMRNSRAHVHPQSLHCRSVARTRGLREF